MTTENHNRQAAVLTDTRGDRACRTPIILAIPIQVLMCAAFLGASLGAAAAIGVIGYKSNKERVSGPKSSQGFGISPASSIRGILYLEKSHRLALNWENGDFELWDTEHGRRKRRVERLSRRFGWCVASPDEATILIADPMVGLYDSADRNLLWKRFIPFISIWDTKSGERKHLIRVPEAGGDPLYMHEWYARWLDNSHVLLVRTQRKNPARLVHLLRLIVVNIGTGEIDKSSGELEIYVGEDLVLSPNRKMALVKSHSSNRRRKDGRWIEGIGGAMWPAYTHVFDLDRLTVASSLREPRDPKAPDWQLFCAIIARWCPDGKTVLTTDTSWTDDHPSPKIRFWDARGGRLLQTLSSGHKGEILDLAFTSTGDKLLTASGDRTVRVWDTRTGKLEKVLSGHQAGLNKVIVVAGDKLAVSAAEEPVAKVWDLTTGQLRFNLPGHDSAVLDVEIVSDRIIRTITLRGTATTWDCSTGKRIQVTPKPPKFPKRFGVCELIEREGKLYMQVLKK